MWGLEWGALGGKDGRKVGFGELGVGGKNLVGGFSGGEFFEDQVDGDAGAFEARFSVYEIWGMTSGRISMF